MSHEKCYAGFIKYMKKKISKNLVISFLISIIVVCAVIIIVQQLDLLNTDRDDVSKTKTLLALKKCENYKGFWIDDFSECEYISEDDCLTNGGYFNSCASACRHDANAEMCTMQCVPVCDYSVLNSKAEKIRVLYPRPNITVENSYLEIIGQARGSWYFEASFPILIKNIKGDTLYSGNIMTRQDWMTNDFVSFRKDLKLPPDIKGKVLLILKNDNPSGVPEKDEELVIPLKIK